MTRPSLHPCGVFFNQSRRRPCLKFCLQTERPVTWSDKDVLESVNSALESLQDFTDALSGEAYVSVSYVKPTLHLFRTESLADEEEDTSLTREIKSKALAYLEEKYNDPACQELLDVASFLDPRFKFDYMSIPALDATKARVKTEMEQVAQKVTFLKFVF